MGTEHGYSWRSKRGQTHLAQLLNLYLRTSFSQNLELDAWLLMVQVDMRLGGRLATKKAGHSTYGELHTTKKENNNTEIFPSDSSFAQLGIPIDPAILHSASAQLTPDIPITSIEGSSNKHPATAHHTSKPTKNNSLPQPKTIFVATCAALNDANAMSSINLEFLECPLIGTFQFFPSNTDLAEVSRYFEPQFGLDNPPPGARRL